MRVLICDDTAALRHELRIGLEAEGFLVVGEAGDGVEAERLAHELRPDGFVVDLSMPRRDGLELVPELRRQYPDARIIVFSGFEADRMRASVLRLGADAYLEKGCDFAELVSALAGGSAAAVSTTVEPAPVRPHGMLDAVNEVHERDMARISERIHDGPVQVLTAAAMLLRGPGRDPGRSERVIGEVAGHLEDVIAELRETMSNLAAWDLGGASPEDAIRGVAQGAARRGNMLCETEIGDLSQLPPGHCSVAFRTIQEAVVNAAKHSRGDRLYVAADAGEGTLRIVVSDDGCGFDLHTPPAEGHFGLQLLRRRVESAGGHVTLASRPGIGTTVTASLPLAA